MTYDLFAKFTSSPGSADGAPPSAARAGPTTTPSGPPPVLASLSARQAAEAGLLTSGTFGPPSITLPRNAALMSSLASNLHRKTASLGSTLYRLTWKQRATPAGRSICAQRASVRRISVSDFTLSGWPTPRSSDTNGAGLHGDGGMDLRTAATLAGWPTPMAGTPAQKGYNEAGNTDSGRKTQAIAQAAFPARLTASGEMLTGSSAETRMAPPGAPLNPAHSLWLQAYPVEWLSCGVRAMQSMSKSRRGSSKR